jgi:alkanesulfonate monooxygenase SsuD/methylene tetrahydromethanopterin reductase-like flavin-dependent oxidoreductase (luciferase family)
VASERRVELLWWRECPSWERALAMLREAMEAAGRDPDSIEVREVDTEASAEREHFVGSPTIRVDGRDVQPPADGDPTGLACRVYRRRDGRTSPLPDPEDLRDALRAQAVR